MNPACRKQDFSSHHSIRRDNILVVPQTVLTPDLPLPGPPHEQRSFSTLETFFATDFRGGHPFCMVARLMKKPENEYFHDKKPFKTRD
jgi:hypothetical protein